MNILITGAGGFIGGHLVKAMHEQGHTVRAVDIKDLGYWYQRDALVEYWSGTDLRDYSFCKRVVEGQQLVFNLACNMGGMGFIETHKADCMLSVLINTNLLLAAKEAQVERYFFSSSACVYPNYRQGTTDMPALKEEHAYPAMAEDGYGWEKLFSERMCIHFKEDFGFETRIARFHNVYGPFGTYEGGREKAPAALCRKVIRAKLSGNNKIEVWGDGDQTRSFMFIDDCIKGVELIMGGNFALPVNLGSSELVTINQLLDIIESIAGIKTVRHYNTDKPQGVRGRNSDNTLIKELYDWEPSITLQTGLEKTYEWIYNDMISVIR